MMACTICRNRIQQQGGNDEQKQSSYFPCEFEHEGNSYDLLLSIAVVQEICVDDDPVKYRERPGGYTQFQLS
jgi:hypothetical protein